MIESVNDNLEEANRILYFLKVLQWLRVSNRDKLETIYWIWGSHIDHQYL